MKFATYLILTICSTLFMSTVLYAQGGPEAADPSTNPVEWYTSIGGVGIATIFVVGVLKKFLADVAYFGKIPTWVVSIVVASSLTALCVYVLGTLPGEPMQLVWQSVYNAAIASGVHSWLGNPSTSLTESSKSSLMDSLPTKRARRTRKKTS